MAIGISYGDRPELTHSVTPSLTAWCSVSEVFAVEAVKEFLLAQRFLIGLLSLWENLQLLWKLNEDS